MSKREANASAEKEYAQFAAKRRALLEAEGADYNVKMLDAAAKALPKSTKEEVRAIDGDQESLPHLERCQNQASYERRVVQRKNDLANLVRLDVAH